jgi:putative aldouronate transport system substrate-binding protein
VHYSPVPAFAKAEYESEKAGMDNTAPLPTVGLDSPTDLDKGASLTATMTNLQGEVIRGQKSLKDWDAAVQTWKKNGGDTIRAEYEESSQKSQH